MERKYQARTMARLAAREESFAMLVAALVANGVAEPEAVRTVQAMRPAVREVGWQLFRIEETLLPWVERHAGLLTPELVGLRARYTQNLRNLMPLGLDDPELGGTRAHWTTSRCKADGDPRGRALGADEPDPLDSTYN